MNKTRTAERLFHGNRNEQNPEETDFFTILARVRSVKQLEPSILLVVISCILDLPTVKINFKDSSLLFASTVAVLFNCHPFFILCIHKI